MWSDDGHADVLLDGELFDGVAFDQDATTGERTELAYELGKRHGPTRIWARGGTLTEERYYVRGVDHGPHRTWRADGGLATEDIYDHRERIAARRWSEAGVLVDDARLAEDRAEIWVVDRLGHGAIPLVELDADDLFVDQRWPYDGLVPAALRDQVAALERALLALIEQGGDAASWHWIATRLPLFGVEPRPDAMRALEALRWRRWVNQRPVGGGLDRWTLTERGRIEHALAPLLAALRGPIDGAIAALIPLAADGPAMIATLHRVLVADTRLADRVALGAAMLPPPDRAGFADALARHPDGDVRYALFTTWAPARRVRGTATRLLPDDAWDALLRLGLADRWTPVRAAAAALAYTSDRAAAVAGALRAIADGPDDVARPLARRALAELP